jgi:hypothetical protein
MRNLIAQTEIPLGSPFKGIGPLGEFEPGEASGVFTKFISSIVGLMTIIGIIWFVFLLIAGAIGIISSGGDKASLENSRKRITTGLVGLIVIVAAIFIIRLIGKLIGIPNILDLPALLEQIQE